MPSLEVVFSVKGLDKQITAFNKVAQASTQVAQTQQKNANKVADSYAKGPFSRLAGLQAQMSRATAAGDVTAQKDLSYLLARTQKQIDAAKPKSFGSRLASVVSTSRLNFGGGGGGISPLAGKLAGLVAEGGEGGPVALGVTALAGAAVAAAGGLVALSQKAAEAANEFSRMRFATGSGAGTAAALSVLGGAGGFDAASLASSFNSRISSDPTAMAFAARFGIRNIGGAYGNQDWGKQLLTAVQGLRNISDFTERVRTARALGLEGALPLTQLSNRQFGRLGQDAGLKASIMTPKFQQDAADFASSIARITDAVGNFVAALGKPVLHDLSDFFNGVADTINYLAQAINRNQNIIAFFKDLAEAFAFQAIGNPVGAAGKMKDAFGDLSAQNQALDNNTGALDRNTSAINGMSGMIPGYYGLNGERGSRAIPDNIGGEYLRRGMEAGGFALGAF
jgi:hypothetical protein